MSQKSFKTLLYLALLQFFFVTCKKVQEAQGPAINVINKLPVSNAGIDLTLTASEHYPVYLGTSPTVNLILKDTIQLDGKKSSDADGQIIAYHWNFIKDHPENTGGIPLLLNDDNSVASAVVSLSGTYWFSLKVTDNAGGTDLDSVKIVQNVTGVIDFTQIDLNAGYLGKLDQSAIINIVPAENTVFVQYYVDSFYSSNNGYSSGPDKFRIYHTDSKTWTDFSLPQSRFNVNMVSTGNKVLFSGGSERDGTGYFNKVDILDLNSGNLSQVDLPLSFKVGNSVAVGNKILFTSGTAINDLTEKRIEVLDLNSLTWTNTNMSIRRYQPTIVAAGDEIVIAGGITPTSGVDNVDIYNVQTNTWRNSPRKITSLWGSSGVAIDDKVYWSGGYYENSYSHPIEIWDSKTGTSEFIWFGEGFITLHKMGDQLLIAKNINVTNTHSGAHWSPVQLYKFDQATKTWTFGQIPGSTNRIGGIGAIIGAPNQPRIFGVGPYEYPNVTIDWGWEFPLPDHVFWDLAF